MKRRSAGLGILALGAALFAVSPATVEVRIRGSLEEAAGPGGGPLLLVFFSTDCPTCYEDLFEARYLIDQGGWPVSVVGVYAGPKEELRSFLEKYAWTLPVVLDRPKTLFRKYKVDVIPHKTLLARGRVIYRDDPYKDPGRRREDLKKCLQKMFSR